MSANEAEKSFIKLQIDQSITLRLPDAAVELSALITEVSDDKITARLTSPRNHPLNRGDRVLAKSWNARALYFFFVKVLDVSGTDVVLSHPATGVEIQRRKSPRVEAAIPLRGLVASSSRDELIGELVRDLQTQDISGEGLRFETVLPLEIGDTLSLTLDLSEQQSVEVYGWVVWTELQQSGQKAIHSVGMSFFQLHPEEQMQLLQFLGRYETSDRREFARWEASIPCKVAWGNDEIEGQIANLSVDGALITGVPAVPPEGGAVVVSIPVGNEKIILASRVTSRVIHSAWEQDKEEKVGLFGVEFVGSGEELRLKLTPVLRHLFSKDRPISGSGEEHSANV